MLEKPAPLFTADSKVTFQGVCKTRKGPEHPPPPLRRDGSPETPLITKISMCNHMATSEIIP